MRLNTNSNSCSPTWSFLGFGVGRKSEFICHFLCWSCAGYHLLHDSGWIYFFFFCRGGGGGQNYGNNQKAGAFKNTPITPISQPTGLALCSQNKKELAVPNVSRGGGGSPRHSSTSSLSLEKKGAEGAQQCWPPSL